MIVAGCVLGNRCMSQDVMVQGQGGSPFRQILIPGYNSRKYSNSIFTIFALTKKKKNTFSLFIWTLYCQSELCTVAAAVMYTILQ